MRGEQAEPALQAMLERLYEDATSFGFPEERFERVYGEVEQTLYRDTVRSTVVAPLPGLELESERLDLGDCLFLAREGTIECPQEALWPDAWPDEQPAVLCVLQRDVPPDETPLVEEARRRFPALVSALRLFRTGRVTLAPLGFLRAEGGRWSPMELGGTGPGRGEPLVLLGEEEPELRDFLAALEGASFDGTVAWAMRRFELGCSRHVETEAISDYVLALRALLDATSDSGQASLPLRLAALCAEEGERHATRRRVELALALERWLMGGRASAELQDWIGSEPPGVLVKEIESHLRALLRDVVCGYLEPDLKGLADDILLETAPEPFALEEERFGEVEARDLRESEAAERETTEYQAVEPATDDPVEVAAVPNRHRLDGVTESADWGWDDPEDFSAPV
jgi:hypothetical protein